MGRILILPRAGVALDTPPERAPERPVPDFAARLALWRQRDAERREHFREDMHYICLCASEGAACGGHTREGA